MLKGFCVVHQSGTEPQEGSYKCHATQGLHNHTCDGGLHPSTNNRSNGFEGKCLRETLQLMLEISPLIFHPSVSEERHVRLQT